MESVGLIDLNVIDLNDLNDLNEKLNVVFFARAMQDYGTGYEKVWMDNINEAFSPCEIVDFDEVKKRISRADRNKIYGKELYEFELKYFFPWIDKCDYIVAAPAWNHVRKGKYTAGVIIEIEYALGIGKKVFGIVGTEMKRITAEDLKEIKGE